MHIYLIRHAHADDGVDDALRPLRKKGLRQIRDMGRFLRESGAMDANVFWHSPLIRAAETANRLAKRLKSSVKLVQVGGLRPQDDPDVIARKLGDLHAPVAVIGHDPHLSALASLLVGVEAEPPRFVLKKCGVIRLDRSSRGWSVRWQVSPELLK